MCKLEAKLCYLSFLFLPPSMILQSSTTLNCCLSFTGPCVAKGGSFWPVFGLLMLRNSMGCYSSSYYVALKGFYNLVHTKTSFFKNINKSININTTYPEI